MKPSLLGLWQFLVHPDSQSDLCVGSLLFGAGHHSSKTGALLDPGLQGLTGPAGSCMDLSRLTMANDQRGEGTHGAPATNSLPARMKGQIRVLVTCPSSLVNIYNSIKVQDFSTWENVNGVSAFSMMGRPPWAQSSSAALHPLVLFSSYARGR